LAERKKRAQKAKLGATVVETSAGKETSAGFESMIAADQSRNLAGRQSVMLPAGSFDSSI
jgi:hypothetical protein